MPSFLQSLIRNTRCYDGAVAISDTATQVTRAGLVARVAAYAEELQGTPRTLGLLGDNGVDWCVAQLAAWAAGRVVVPLPSFFSPAQLKYLIADSQITHVMATRSHAATALQLGLSPILISEARTERDPTVQPGGGQIIYTSGSTGAPKGVRLRLEQIEFSAAALATATDADKSDVYLSLLPMPLLLETICGICIPLLAGARSVFDPALTRSIAAGSAAGVAAAVRTWRPTTTVLVPQLLSQWVAELSASGARAPDTLRYVAVGGAPLATQLADKAWSLGVPVHEGYGLSECCSVVALNRPGRRTGGTVGRPLEGVTVGIENGEIVVDGPTVMDGYLGKGPVSRPLHTGDLGHWDGNGNLVVEGRKDSLIVTSFGRNVSPEWIEAMLTADPRVAAAAVTGHGRDKLTALVVPSRLGAAWLSTASKPVLLSWIADACRDAPAYATPQDCIVIGAETAMHSGVLTGNGRVKRSAAEVLVASMLAGIDPANDDTAKRRA